MWRKRNWEGIETGKCYSLFINWIEVLYLVPIKEEEEEEEKDTELTLSPPINHCPWLNWLLWFYLLCSITHSAVLHPKSQSHYSTPHLLSNYPFFHLLSLLHYFVQKNSVTSLPCTGMEKCLIRSKLCLKWVT